MLYVTTRNGREAFTVQHVLMQDRGDDAGLYVPLHFPELTAEERKRLSEMSFNQCVAEMLNLFFSTKLTSWDVDFCAGRFPVRMELLPYRTIMAELWHNPQWQYIRLENNLRQLLEAKTGDSGNWVTIAIRMALMAGIMCSGNASGNEIFDIAVVSGDFTVPVSAWYLRKMGFPVGNIICCCNENKQLWDLFVHGQMRTDAEKLATIVPEADVPIPVNLERLIFDCGGEEEVRNYLECCDNNGTYFAGDDLLQKMRRSMYVSVVSSARLLNAIPNVYNSYRYLMTPASALAYSGLMDYRSKTGITRSAIVLCDNSPASELKAVAETMNCSQEEVKKLI